MIDYPKLIDKLEKDRTDWNPNEAKKVADFFLHTMPLLTVHANFTVDLRQLGHSVHSAIVESKGPSSAFEAIKPLIEDHFDTPAFAARDPDDFLRNQFTDSTALHLATKARQLGPIEKFFSDFTLQNFWHKIPTKMISTSIGHVASGAEFVAAKFDKATEQDVNKETREIIAKYSLNSIEIVGSVTMTPDAKLRELRAASKDIDSACVTLGIDPSGFGNNGKLAITLANTLYFDKLGGMSAFLQTNTPKHGHFPDSVMAFKAGSENEGFVVHEYAHYLDHLLAAKTIGKPIGNTFYSELPPKYQDAIPQAREALQNVFSVLSGGESSQQEAQQAQKSLITNLCKHVAGVQNYFGMSTAKLDELKNILNERNDFVNCSTSMIQRTDRWEEAIFNSLVTVPDNERSADQKHESLVSKLAVCLDVSEEEAGQRFRSAIPLLEKDIRVNALYSNGMSRYLQGPGEMVKASAVKDMNDRKGEPYWARPAEVFARVVGRPKNSYVQALASITDPSQGVLLSGESKSKTEKAIDTLVSLAGIKQTGLGAKIGAQKEAVLQSAVAVADSVREVSAKIIGKPVDMFNLAARFYQMTKKDDKPKRPANKL